MITLTFHSAALEAKEVQEKASFRQYKNRYQTAVFLASLKTRFTVEQQNIPRRTVSDDKCDIMRLEVDHPNFVVNIYNLIRHIGSHSRKK